MSLLDGLKESMLNPIYDAMMESDMDAEFDFETALEAAVDKQIELSDADIRAILDDSNPDNIVADLTKNDERIDAIANDTVNSELKALEAMLDELEAMESDTPEDDDPSEDPESNESCCKSTESCDEDDEGEDDYLSLDSLLGSVFKN